MSNIKAALLYVLLVVVATTVVTAAVTAAVPAATPAASAAQRPPRPGQPAIPRARPAVLTLPAISQTCPMHPDIVESAPGTCPICKMKLVPVRLESVWSCPIHPVVLGSKAGSCPICKRPLVQMTMALTWTCAGHPEVDQIERGACADGSAMIARRTLRPHGNHNPQHGGQFFMAPDNTHHLEGAYPRERVFRLFLYDDYARPLSTARMNAVQARVVTQETFDPATRTTREISAAPLRPATGGGYLEARVDRAALPAQMTAKVRFKTGQPEYRFDFAFATLSKDPTPPVAPRPRVATAASAAPSRRAVTPGPVSAREPTPQPPSGAAPPPPSDPIAADPSLVPQPIPDNVPEILAHITTRTAQVAELIERGNFAAVYVPAFQAKDLAIALEGRLDRLPPERRRRADPAIQGLVRNAWLLDAVGDVGNRQQITDAFRAFSAYVVEVVAAFGEAR